MIVQIQDGLVHRRCPEYATMAEAIEVHGDSAVFRDLPDHIPPGTGYDLDKDSVIDSEYLRGYVERCIEARKRDVDADYLEALKGLRRGDASENWEARAEAIEAYLDALDAIPSQSGYPASIDWPNAPSE